MLKICPQSRLSSKSPVLNVACPQCCVLNFAVFNVPKVYVAAHYKNDVDDNVDDCWLIVVAGRVG